MTFQTTAVLPKQLLPLSLWITEIRGNSAIISQSQHPLESHRSYSQSFRLTPSAWQYNVKIAILKDPQTFHFLFNETYPPSLTLGRDCDSWLCMDVVASADPTRVTFSIFSLTLNLDKLTFE